MIEQAVPLRRNDEKINAVVNVVNENRRITIRQIAEAEGISYGSAETILTEDLGMTRVCARWVPHLLIPEQNLNRVFKSQEMLDRLFHEGQAFLHRIVTGDESWIHFYEPESKRQSSEWKRAESPPPTKVRASQSALKQMHIGFFDYQGIILDHAVPKGSTVNAVYYRDVLLSQWAGQEKRPQMHPDGFIQHHDNAPSHCWNHYPIFGER